MQIFRNNIIINNIQSNIIIRYNIFTLDKLPVVSSVNKERGDTKWGKAIIKGGETHLNGWS